MGSTRAFFFVFFYPSCDIGKVWTSAVMDKTREREERKKERIEQTNGQMNKKDEEKGSKKKKT